MLAVMNLNKTGCNKNHKHISTVSLGDHWLFLLYYIRVVEAVMGGSWVVNESEASRWDCHWDSGLFEDDWPQIWGAGDTWVWSQSCTQSKLGWFLQPIQCRASRPVSVSGISFWTINEHLDMLKVEDSWFDSTVATQIQETGQPFTPCWHQ